MEAQPAPKNLDDRWVQHQRQKTKSKCCVCRKMFHSTDDLREHAKKAHHDRIPTSKDDNRTFQEALETKSSLKRNLGQNLGARKPQDEQTDPSRRSLSSPTPLPRRSLSGLQGLNVGAREDDTTMDDASDNDHEYHPRKRAAVGDGISTSSGSPLHKSESPLPRRSKARPISLPNASTTDFNPQSEASFEARPQAAHKKLWTPEQDSPFSRSSFNPANVASVQARHCRAQALAPKSRKPFSAPPQSNSRPPISPQCPVPSTILNSRNPSHQASQRGQEGEPYDLMMQPETRPISQEQLVAEVKGIYAGLVMVEAKCIEVDNKQAALAQADGTQSKLNNEQWQALIALHRTLLHEHHDFFLASQHPSASPALRRLASKYAMPARMWRHGIHSFLELLRHRLPASLDHMLAFIYLAYTMMALLYETVPAFEDTWIECLGDLARYRMAIEDDDIRDREVWTGVARNWYSKASDKAPETGRLYHHLAILARPNALQQLFYYAKSLCVVVPFTSARESILTLLEPTLNIYSGQRHYRLAPLDTAFVKAHGALFTGKDSEKLSVQDFTSILDAQIGRVIRKFVEQDYHIAIANSVAMLGFASKENPLVRAMQPQDASMDVHMASSMDLDVSGSLSFQNARHFNIATLEALLARIGDPNVLPFIHVTLVFLNRMSRHSSAMMMLNEEIPWESLAMMLNTLLVTSKTHSRIESDSFPLPEKDEPRPSPEDFAMRALLWADDYFSESWFANVKIEEEEKYHERASMTEERNERIFWLAMRLTMSGLGLAYCHSVRSFSSSCASGFTWISSQACSLGDALRRRLCKALCNKHAQAAAKVFIASQLISGVTARPLAPQQQENKDEGFSHFWSLFTDEYSGVLNAVLAVLCIGTYNSITYFDERMWKGMDLLPQATGLGSLVCYFAGNGEIFSGIQLTMVAAVNIRLSIKILQQKLSVFTNTGKQTAFMLTLASLGLAVKLTKLIPVDDGRYKDTSIQTAMFYPIANLVLTAFWIYFVRDTQVAILLEQGSLYAAIMAFWHSRSFSTIGLCLLLVLLVRF